MKKLVTIVFYLTILPLLKGQDIVGIDSCRHKVFFHDDELWHVVNIHIIFDTGDVVHQIDTIASWDKSKLSERITFNHEINDGFYIEKNTFKYNWIFSTDVDSIKLYTPIKYFSDSINPNLHDTLNVVNYSKFLCELDEPLIYNDFKGLGVIRFLVFGNEKIFLRRIEKENDEILVNSKQALIKLGKVIFIKDIQSTLEIKHYNRILNKLKKGDYWTTHDDYTMQPPNFLIETYIDGDYNYFNGNVRETKHRNKKLLKASGFYPLLKKKCL